MQYALIVALIMLIGCNPFLYTDTVEVDVYMCTAPTTHCRIKIPRNEINIMVLDTIFAKEDGMYRQRLDFLSIKHDLGVVYVNGEFRSEVTGFFHNITFSIASLNTVPTMVKKDILVYLKIGGKNGNNF